MRTTVIIDDELYKKALEMAEPGMDEKETFSEALKSYIQVQEKNSLPPRAVWHLQCRICHAAGDSVIMLR